MEILIGLLLAFAAFAFWKSRSGKPPTDSSGGGSKPSDGNKPDKV